MFTNSTKPYVNIAKLQDVLDLALDEAISRNWGIDVVVPTNPDSTYSTSAFLWKKYAKHHWFISTWIELERCARLENWLVTTQEIANPDVCPQYVPLVRNGRTAAKSPNIQATPRDAGFRELYVPKEGHVFLTVDYKYIELCTLAAICESRFGGSVLATVIRRNVDPHSYTASIMEGTTLKKFMQLKESENKEDRQKYAKLRQNCKAINFGIPSGGGLDAVASEFFLRFLPSFSSFVFFVFFVFFLTNSCRLRC